MKARILCFAIALLVLFSFGTTNAQKASPHINKSDEGSVQISGTPIEDDLGNITYDLCVDYCLIKGIGNATSVTAYLITEGTADANCYNGGKSTGPIPGQSFKTTGTPIEFDVSTNGQIAITGLCLKIQGGCKSKGGKDWTSTVENVNITSLILMINGKPVDLYSYL